MKFACFLQFTMLSVVLASNLARAAAEPKTITVTIPKADKVAIRIPAAWNHTVVQAKSELPPTVKIASASNTVTLQLTFIPDPEGRFATKENVDETVTRANRHYLASSVEKRVTLKQFVSKSGRGAFTTFTDAKLVGVPTPPPRQFRNVLSGLFVVKQQAASITLLSNDTTSLEYQQALRIVSEGISVP